MKSNQSFQERQTKFAKVCGPSDTYRGGERKRDGEREGKVKVVKEKWKDEREGKKDIYIYTYREREKTFWNCFPDPIEGILV